MKNNNTEISVEINMPCHFFIFFNKAGIFPALIRLEIVTDAVTLTLYLIQILM